ncbi:RNA polymerase sigma factor [bacterium]|nr:RNA polymerase sigma factor [bacterium]
MSAVTGALSKSDGPEEMDIILCQKGDMAAMARIYQTYRLSMYNLAYRFSHDQALAEELLQDIFIKAFSSIGSLRDVIVFKSWLYRLAVNMCISFVRKRKREKIIRQESLDHYQDSRSGVNVLAGQLEQALLDLAPKLRSVFILHDVQGFSHPEIAEIMGWSIGTSKSQLFKARRQLRRLLSKV